MYAVNLKPNEMAIVVEKKRSANGVPYYRLTLSDKTGFLTTKRVYSSSSIENAIDQISPNHSKLTYVCNTSTSISVWIALYA